MLTKQENRIRNDVIKSYLLLCVLLLLCNTCCVIDTYIYYRELFIFIRISMLSDSKCDRLNISL